MELSGLLRRSFVYFLPLSEELREGERDARKKRPSYLRRNEQHEKLLNRRICEKKRTTNVCLVANFTRVESIVEMIGVGLVSPLEKHRISIAFRSHFDVNSRMIFRRCCVIRNPRYRPMLLSVRRSERSVLEKKEEKVFCKSASSF